MLTIATIQRTWSKAKEWRQIAQQRRELRGLSDEILKDIGISRSDADFEANRHFWDDSRNNDVTLRKAQTTEIASVAKTECQVCWL
jgi:uncharacterized protein YjiS (DUF1127 family)